MTLSISRTRITRLGLLSTLAAACVLSACAPSKHKADVWDQYDIRVPVPAHSPVPNSAAGYWQYNDPYRVNQAGPGAGAAGYPVDNDAYYMPPVSDINSETYD